VHREREYQAEIAGIADMPQSRQDRGRGCRALFDRQGGDQRPLDVGSFGGLDDCQAAQNVRTQSAPSIELTREKPRGLFLNVVRAFVQDAADQIPAAVLVVCS